jgi:hypothetical protein
MFGRMPILRGDDALVFANDAVDERHDFVSIGNRQRAAGNEIILHVEDDQSRFTEEAHSSIFAYWFGLGRGPPADGRLFERQGLRVSTQRVNPGFSGRKVQVEFPSPGRAASSNEMGHRGRRPSPAVLGVPFFRKLRYARRTKGTKKIVPKRRTHSQRRMVEPWGIEPQTPTMPLWCSTN